MTTKTIFVGSLIALAFTYPVLAKSPKNVSPCTFAEDTVQCERKLEDFQKWLPKANSGDYASQREVAFCYSNGCHGALSIDIEKACMWQIVIVATTKADNTDAANFRSQCEQLNTDKRASAKTAAEHLFNKIYNKPMKKPFPYESADCLIGGKTCGAMQ